MNRFCAVMLTVLLVSATLAVGPRTEAAADAEDTFGFFDPATGLWFVQDSHLIFQVFYFGNPGDYPFMGDWDCDDIDTPGLYRQSDGYVYLRNSNTQGIADISFYFGNPGDVPIAGDFNADGCDTVSIYRPSEQRFYIINKLGTNDGGLGAAEYSFMFGNPGDKPFVGDFNGNDQDTIGLHRESTGLVYFRNTNTTGIADNQFYFGDPGDRLMAGDWTGDGIDSPGLFRPSNSTTYLRHTNTQGNADEQWTLGQSQWLPIAGRTGFCDAQASIPPHECEALIELFTSTGGPEWYDSTGWLVDADPCNWVGIVCTANSVTEVLLPWNGLSAAIPPTLAELIKLQVLRLDGNELSGRIPPQFGGLANLQVLDLEYNQLTGPIPTELAELPNLEQLRLGGNRLYGSIPAELGNLTNLVWLSLETNDLDGPIPAQLGSLTELRVLYLDDNSLTEPIPPSLGNLTSLWELGLGWNELSGSIPAELGNLTNLTHLRMDHNSLSGPVPTTLVNLTSLFVLYLGGQNGCLTAATPTLAAWLDVLDPDWDDGCPAP